MYYSDKFIRQLALLTFILFIATMVLGWFAYNKVQSTDESPKSTEIVGTFQFTSYHDTESNRDIPLVEITLTDTDYPYWYGSVDENAVKSGDFWFSTAFNHSDEKIKKMRYDPTKQQLEFYMKNGDAYVFVLATNSSDTNTSLKAYELK